MPPRIAPPRHLDELRIRAEALDGHTLGEIAAALDFSLAGSAVRTKGPAGELVERALGASAGSAAAPDFPSLGVELKTIPIDAAGRPRETTFVCAFGLDEADAATWETSIVRLNSAGRCSDGADSSERSLSGSSSPDSFLSSITAGVRESLVSDSADSSSANGSLVSVPARL